VQEKLSVIFKGIACILLFQVCCLQAQEIVSYPFAKKDKVVDNYFGKTIEDDYRWMENTNDSSLSVWVKAENELTESYFSKIPYYTKIEKNIRDKSTYYQDLPYKRLHKYAFSLHSYNKVSKKYFENYNPVLWYRTEFENWKELVNPLTLRNYPDENVRITNYWLSPNDDVLVLSVSRNGSDWNELFTYNISSKKISTTSLKWIKVNDLIWYRNGFFYQRYKKPSEGLERLEQNHDYSLYYHTINDSQDNDVKINIEGFSSMEIINGKDFIVKHLMRNGNSNFNLVSFLEFNDSLIAIKKLRTFIVYPAKKRYTVDIIGINNDSAIVRTDLHANNGIIARYNLGELNRFDTLIKEYQEVLTQAFYFNEKINCIYQKDFKHYMAGFSKNGIKEKIHFFSNFSSVSFYPVGKKSVLFFDESTFSQPEITCQFNFKDYSSNQISTTYVDYKPHEYVTELKEFKAPDGAKIPLILFYKKGLKPQNNNPVLLTAYGGFGIINNPSYDYMNLLWVESGGILAVASIRGGGEKGKTWHFAGSGINKQKSIDDFSSAAKFLIDQNYTSPGKLGSIGASNGGLVVAGSAIQHPELFKAVIPNVGIFDMLRYQNFTVGNGFTDEYGASSDSAECHSLLRYSPLHNIKDSVNYPSMLIITNDHDDRVPPFHSYKLAASLQGKNRKANPILLYTGNNAGHYGNVLGKNRYRVSAYILSFLFDAMHMKPKLLNNF
jgi:prolyl oligopeptidase